MKPGLKLCWLVLLNIVLAAGIIWNLQKAAPTREANSSLAPVILEPARSLESREKVARQVTMIVPATPFLGVYSSTLFDFANNLRRVGCPEQTVKDILMAEVNRRYHKSEEALRPKPADHVPFMWSPKTSEAKLLERRREAASIAREKESLLRNALGYEVQVDMPLYAMTVSDERFQEMVGSLPSEKQQAAHQAQEQYWMRVDQLQARTHGFWEPADVEELNQLKQERNEILNRLGNANGF
jgi:hypothetical protein